MKMCYPPIPHLSVVMGSGREDLEGPTPPKLFLAPAKGGGAPPDACGVGGAAAPSAASPSVLAGGRRIRHRQRWTERGPSTR